MPASRIAPSRRFLGQVGGRHARLGDVPLADAGPLEDPLVGGVDQLFEVGVGQDPRRHEGGQPGDLDRSEAALCQSGS